MQVRLVAIANDEHTNGFLITALETRTPGIRQHAYGRAARFRRSPMKLSVDCPDSINHRHGTPTDAYDGWRRGAAAGPRGGRALAFVSKAVSKAGHPSEPQMSG